MKAIQHLRVPILPFLAMLLISCGRSPSGPDLESLLEAPLPERTAGDREFEESFPDVSFNGRLRLALKSVDEAFVSPDGTMHPRMGTFVLRIRGSSAFSLPSGGGAQLYVYRPEERRWERIPSGYMIIGADERIPPSPSGHSDVLLDAGLTWGAVGNALSIDPNSAVPAVRVLVIGAAADGSGRYGAYLDVSAPRGAGVARR